MVTSVKVFDERGRWATSLRRRSIAVSLIAELRGLGVIPFKDNNGSLRFAFHELNGPSDFYRELCAEFREEISDAIGDLRHSNPDVVSPLNVMEAATDGRDA